jgi:phage portal protein BeeE
MASLENLSLFENNMVGQVPFSLEKLKNLKEMNISYNKFNGLVSRNLAQLDMMNMTMINDKGVATTLQVDTNTRSNSALAAEDE